MRSLLVALLLCPVLVATPAFAGENSDDPCEPGLSPKPGIKMATLRNGRTVPAVIAKTTWIALERLAHRNTIAAFELVQLARDPNHDLSAHMAEVLKGYGLIEDDGKTIHDAIRDIVLAAADGDDLDLRFVFPISE